MATRNRVLLLEGAKGAHLVLTGKRAQRSLASLSTGTVEEVTGRLEGVLEPSGSGVGGGEVSRTAVVLPARIEKGREGAAAAQRVVQALARVLMRGLERGQAGARHVPSLAALFEEVPWPASPQSAESVVDLRQCLQDELANLQVDSEGDHMGSYQRAEQLAEVGIGPILLLGPTGSGKSALARRLAKKREGPFVSVNVGAIDPGVLEARMRGHKKGAYTGATSDGVGWFEKAHRGTLFLDELQSAPLAVQVLLLDLLSPVSNDVRVSRLGDDGHHFLCNVQVILAVNEPVQSLLAEKRLRPDFFERVRYVHTMPSLSERIEASEVRAQEKLIRQLFYQFRWTHGAPSTWFEHQQEGMVLKPLFPECSSELVAFLARQAWRGSYRELERTLVEVFINHDREGGEREITPDAVERVMLSLRGHMHEASDAGEPSPMWDRLPPRVRRKIERADQALRAADFQIEAACRILAGDGMKNSATVRKLLRDYHRGFPAATQKEPRFQALVARLVAR